MSFSDHGFQHFKSRNETTDDCGDFYLEEQLDGSLPEDCGPVVYVGTEKRQVLDGSGHGSSFDEREDARLWPVTTAQKVTTLLAVLSGPPLSQRSTPPAGVVHDSGGTPLPTPHTLRPEVLWWDFRVQLGVHMNRFNQRLSMLEANVLDVKESLQGLKDQQNNFSLQLEELIGRASRTDKSEQIKELEKTYTDVEGKLHRLESRLEILIDGFTTLAQELYKIKRARHVARRPKGGRASEVTAAMVKVDTMTKTATRATVSTRAHRTAVPKSIPLSHTTRTTHTSQQNGQHKVIVTSAKGLSKSTVRKFEHSNRRKTSNYTKTNLTFKKGNKQQNIIRTTYPKTPSSHLSTKPIPYKQQNTTRTTYPKTTPSSQLSTKPIPYQNKRRKSTVTHSKTPKSKLTTEQIQQHLKKKPSGERTRTLMSQGRAQKKNGPAHKTINSRTIKPQFQVEPPSHVKSGPTKEQTPKRPSAAPPIKDKKAPPVRYTVKPKSSTKDLNLAPAKKATTELVIGKPHTLQMNRKTKHKNGPSRRYHLDPQSRNGALDHESKPRRGFERTHASANPTPSKKPEHSSQNVKPNSKRQKQKNNVQSRLSILDILGLKGQVGQNTGNGEIQNGELLITLGKLAIPIKIIPDF